MPNLQVLFPVLAIFGAIGAYIVVGQASWWMAAAFFGVPILGATIAFLIGLRGEPERRSAKGPEKDLKTGARSTSKRDLQ